MSWPSTDFEVEIERELAYLRHAYQNLIHLVGGDVVKEDFINEYGEDELPEGY